MTDGVPIPPMTRLLAVVVALTLGGATSRGQDAGSIPPAAPAAPKLADIAEFDELVAPRVELSPFQVIRESLLGPADRSDWKPLSLRTFFTEGWTEPFAKAPGGTNGAPEQYWLGAPSAVFGRDVAFDTFYTNHLNNVIGLFLTPNAPFLPVHPGTDGNQYTGYATAELPLNQRAMLYVGTAFINSNKSSPAGGYVGNWGDSEVQLKLRLVSRKDFSLLGFVGDRIPTGRAVNGSGINFVNEGFEFWWNAAPKWVVRGSSFINILTGRKTSTSVYINQLAIGRYLTTEQARCFKQLVVYSTFSSLTDISGGRGHVTDVYAFPGFRFGLDDKERYYILGGVNVPLSGPRPFDWQPQLAIYRYF